MAVLKTVTSAAARRGGQLSTPVLRPAVNEDLERVVRLADSTLDPTAPSLEDSLARHFSVPWQNNNSPGLVLAQGQEIVGFMATLTHSRQVQGQLQTICNLASWYVSAAYRRHSLSLLREAVRRRDVTYTAISPIARVARISKHFGFQQLETHRRVIYPTLNFRPLRPRPEITVGDVSSLLSPDQLKIFHDHHEFSCEHAVLEHNGRQCYIVLVRKPRRFFSSARIDYLSDRSLFGSCICHIAGQLCRKLGVTSVSVHDRFLGDTNVPFSKRRPLKVPYMFRSNSLSPGDIDSLYSECVVMGF
jgi:hypothetical protein